MLRLYDTLEYWSYMKNVLLIILFASIHLQLSAQGNAFNLGITLGGGELGENQLPGIYNEHYAYPTEEELAYFQQKGFKVITIPFRWERVQKTLSSDLDFGEIGEIRKVVAWAARRDISVILSMNNAGRYRKNGVDYIVGGYAVSRNDFSNVWNRLANAFSGYPNIYGFDIMAEPHDMQAFDWFTTAQLAINAIREADRRNAIIISGNNYAASESWMEYSDQLKNLKDPQDRIIFKAHCYFDNDFTGKYLFSYDQNQATDSAGIIRVMPFIQWLKQNNKRGIVGQFGVPDTDQRWLIVMEKFLQFLKEKNISAQYCSSGRRLSSNPVSVYPLAQAERPQMQVLQQFLTGVEWKEKTVTASNESDPKLMIKAAATVEPELPPVSFLFLPGTILLPQPNGGLYKPTPKGAEKGVRIAKYNNQ